MAKNRINARFVVDAEGERESVLLDVRDFERLLERLEDLEDAVALDQARRSARRFRDYKDIRSDIRKSRRL